MRDCGSGQTIDQINIYGKHVRYFFEVGTPEILGFRLRYLRSLIGRSVSMATGKVIHPQVLSISTSLRRSDATCPCC